MSHGETTAKRWKIGVGGLLVFVTAMSLSLGLWRFGFNLNESHSELQPIAALLAIVIFGGAIGGLWGYLQTGDKIATIGWITVGGVIALLCTCLLPNVYLWLLHREPR